MLIVPPRGAVLTYGINDAVKVTGLSRPYLYRKMQAGEIEYRKIGARRLIVARSLEDFIERGKPALAA